MIAEPAQTVNPDPKMPGKGSQRAGKAFPETGKVTIIRKLTLADAEAIAKLVSKRITEQGACLMLGIKPTSWFQWKCRHKNQALFEHLVIRIRETKLNACIDSIDESGNPYEVTTKNGAVYTKPGDWRAKAWLAERVLAPERLGDRVGIEQAGAVASPVINNMLVKIYTAEKRVEIEPSKKRVELITDAQVVDSPVQASIEPDWHQFTG